MENRESNEVVDLLKKLGNGDAWKTHHFGFVRESQVHGSQMVEVEVFERVVGPGDRYMVSARADTGGAASGNSADTLSQVLATVHWGDLDK